MEFNQTRTIIAGVGSAIGLGAIAFGTATLAGHAKHTDPLVAIGAVTGGMIAPALTGAALEWRFPSIDGDPVMVMAGIGVLAGVAGAFALFGTGRGDERPHGPDGGLAPAQTGATMTLPVQ